MWTADRVTGKVNCHSVRISLLTIVTEQLSTNQTINQRVPFPPTSKEACLLLALGESGIPVSVDPSNNSNVRANLTLIIIIFFHSIGQCLHALENEMPTKRSYRLGGGGGPARKFEIMTLGFWYYDSPINCRLVSKTEQERLGCVVRSPASDVK